MTVAGWEVYNDDGVLQANTANRNHSYITKGSATCNTPLGGASTLYYAQVTVTGANAPMVAIAPGGSAAIGLFSVTVSGSTWTFNYIGVSGSTFDYYVFDYAEPISGSSGARAGLELYDEYGNITFSSEQPVMRVVGGGEGVTVVTGLSASRDYAVVQTGPGYSQTYHDLGFTIRYQAKVYAVYRPSATEARLNELMFEDYTTGSVGTDVVTPAPFMIVVDVTNY